MPVLSLKRSMLLIALAVALAALGLPTGPASAATIIVNTTADEGGASPGDGCALREAIISANTNASFGGCSPGTVGPDTLTVLPGTYTLAIGGAGEDAAATGDLDITEDLTITGAGARTTTVNGAQLDRVFQVHSVTGAMSGLTITGGRSPDTSPGGAIDVDAGTLRLTGVHLTGNQSTEYGGAIHTDAGVLHIADSALTANTAENDGGAIDHYDGMSPATSTLTNVTISGNASGPPSGYGGGISVDDDNPLVLNNVTVSGNTATGSPTVEAGGIGAGDPPALTTSNTIVAGNSASVGPDCTGTLASLGHNIIGNSTDCTIGPASGDQIGTAGAPINPLLGPLADNGGPGTTHALLKGSPAIDAGDPAALGSGGTACASTDQRGAPRKSCDIGAYERVLCQKRVVNRVGTSGNDELKGTGAKDGLLSLGGKDKLVGKGGADGLCGGPGKDLLKGAGGKDRLDGGPGKDVCVGAAGRDRARGCEVERTI